MRVLNTDDFSSSEADGERAHLVRNSGPLGAALLAMGVVANVWAHTGTAGSSPDGNDALLRSSVLVVLALLATGVGIPLIVHGARMPSRHLFRFGVLRLAALTLFVAGVAHLGTLLWADFLGEVWRDGKVGACVIAGVGSLSAGAATLVFAVVTARIAWRVFLDEYWAHDS